MFVLTLLCPHAASPDTSLNHNTAPQDFPPDSDPPTHYQTSTAPTLFPSSCFSPRSSLFLERGLHYLSRLSFFCSFPLSLVCFLALCVAQSIFCQSYYLFYRTSPPFPSHVFSHNFFDHSNVQLYLLYALCVPSPLFSPHSQT